MEPSGAEGLAARVADVLDALSGDLAETEVDERIGRLVREIGGGADAASVRRLGTSAARVRDVLRSAHRKQAELSGLYATARDLAAVRDLDEVLLAIVRRAQELMPSADAAYLVTRDEETGGFRMRAGVGLVSPAFRNVHVPPGTGMSARIEETRSAHWTSVYLSTSTIRHDIRLDRALAEDGLTSVLGTPLLVRSRVVGVLFTANRVERSYSREEVAALSAFADHASVAMENARLFAELEAAHAAAAEDLASMEHSALLHDALAELVIRGGDATGVVRVLEDAFGGDVAVTDRDGHVTVGRGVDVDHPVVADQIGESSRSGRSVVRPAVPGWRHVAAVGSGTTQLGALVLVLPERLDARGLHSLERAAQIVTLLALRQAAVVEAEERVRGELLTELLSSPGAVSEHARLRAAGRHVDLDRPHVLLAVAVGGDRRAAARAVVLDAARARGGLGGEHAGVLVAMLPSDDPERAAVELHARLRAVRAPSVLVCASDPVAAGEGRLHAAAVTASRCVRLLERLGRTDAATSTRALALYGILLDPVRAEDLRRYLDGRLGPLLAHDREHGSELVTTLSVYLAQESSTARTARALVVHTNTVVKRLGRIARLLGPDWRDEAQLLELRVALHLQSLVDVE